MLKVADIRIHYDAKKKRVRLEPGAKDWIITAGFLLVAISVLVALPLGWMALPMFLLSLHYAYDTLETSTDLQITKSNGTLTLKQWKFLESRAKTSVIPLQDVFQLELMRKDLRMGGAYASRLELVLNNRHRIPLSRGFVIQEEQKKMLKTVHRHLNEVLS